MSREFRVQVSLNGDGTGRLHWSEQVVDADTLHEGISLAADDAIIGHDLRRLSVEIPANDVAARRALHRAGFRAEGRLRQALRTSGGEYLDVMVYARLATDVVYGPEGFSGVMDSVLPTKRVIGHVVFRDVRGRVLLLETTYKSDWELPGGVVEPGESPRVGTEREVLEELGMAVALRAPALVDWMPPYLGWGDAIEFLYDGGVLSEDVVVRLSVTDGELHDLHWVDPAAVAEHVTALSARRIAAVLEGRHGCTEDGRFHH